MSAFRRGAKKPRRSEAQFGLIIGTGLADPEGLKHSTPPTKHRAAELVAQAPGHRKKPRRSGAKSTMRVCRECKKRQTHEQ